MGGFGVGIGKAALRLSLMLGVAACSLAIGDSAKAQVVDFNTTLFSGQSPDGSLDGSYTFDAIGSTASSLSFLYYGAYSGTSAAASQFTVGQGYDTILFNVTGGSYAGSVQFTLYVDPTTGAVVSNGSTITAGQGVGGLFVMYGDYVYPLGIPLTVSNTDITTAQANLASNVGGSVNPAFDGGTLTIDSSTPLSSNFTVSTNGGTIDAAGTPVTFSGVISDLTSGGSLVIADSNNANSVVTFTGANTYTGGTTINQGATLALAGSGSVSTSSAVAVNGAFDISGAANGGTSVNNLTGSGTVYLGGNNLTLNGGGNNFSGSISDGGLYGGDTGSLTVYDGASATLSGVNTYSGATTINQGATLALSGGGSIAFSSGVANNGTFDIVGTTSGAQIKSLSGNGSVVMGNKTLTLTAANDLFSGVISGNGGLAITGGTEVLTGNNTYGGGTTITGATLIVGDGGSAGSITGPVTNNGTLVFNRSNGVSFAGAISGGGALVVEGGGTLTLSGTNSYTGATSIYGSTLVIGAASNIGTGTIAFNGGTLLTTAGLNLANAVTLASNSTSAISTNRTDIFSGGISGGGNLIKSGNGTLTLTGDDSSTGITQISAGTLQIGNGGTTGSISGAIYDNSALVFNRSNAITYAGAISGAGSVTQSGAGTLTLSGNNSGYSGTTTINSGTLAIGSASNIGSGTIALGGGTLQTTASFSLSNAVNFASSISTIDTGANTTFLSGAITGSGNLIKAGSGALVVTGTDSMTGTTTVNAGSLQIGGGASGSISGNIVDNAAVVFDRSSAISYGGNITGTGGLVQAGGSSLTLTGANSYSNGTLIENNSSLIIAAIGNLGTGGINFSSGTLKTTGTISTGQAVNLIGAATFDVAGASTTLSGTISGNGSLTKTDGGTLILTGTDSHGGGTTISGGTLQVGNGGNAGWIAGNITDNASLVFDRSDNVSYSGTVISGSGSVTQLGAGYLVMSGTQTYAGPTTISAGGLGFSANTSLAGALTNNSVLDLGTNKLTVAGAVTGTGLIDLTVGSQTHGYINNYSQTGSQTGSSLNTMAVAINSGTVTSNETLLLVNNYAGATPGNLLTAYDYHLFHVVQASAAGQDSQGIGYTAGALLLSDVVANSAVVPTNNASLAVTNYNGSNVSLQQLSFAVQSLTSPAAINKAGAQLRPEANGGTQAAASSAAGQALQAITVHNDNVRTAQAGGTGLSAGESGAGLGLWGQSFGTTADQGTRKGIDGYASNTMGFALGGDAEVFEQTRLGAAIAYAKTNVGDKASRDGSGEKVNSYIASVYGSYTGEPWYVDGTLNAGHHDYDSTRLVAIPGAATEIAKGSFSAFQYGAKAEAGYPIPVDSYKVTPLASLAYSHLGQQSYTETQAVGADLAVARLGSESLRSGIGAKVATTFDAGEGWAVEPTLRASWLHEFKNKSVEQTSQFVAAGGGAFTTPGVKQAADSAALGAGLNLAGPDGMSFSVKYDAELKDKYTSHTGVLEARIDF
jgi:outer membrane autotransporter protein